MRSLLRFSTGLSRIALVVAGLLPALGSNALASTQDVAFVRTSLDDATSGAPQGTPTPRRIRLRLDEAAPLSPPEALVPVERRIQPPPSRRLFRLTLDGESASLSGRLIRVSLDDNAIVYGRLDDAAPIGRRVRTTLD